MSKYFLEITSGGPCKHFGRGRFGLLQALSGTKTVTMKLTKKAAVNLTTLQGRRQWEGQWCPAPPFHVWSTVAAYIQYCIEKCGPLVVLAPLPLLRNPGGGPATLPLHIHWASHWPRVIWKMDSAVLFHRLYVTIINSQRQKKRMLIVIHFNPSRSFFYRDLLLAA